MEFEPKIVYEDNHLLVVVKPQNIAVQEDESKDDDLLNLLKNYIKIRDKKPGNVFLGLVHRLDRPTGGVMVFAKTSKCASRLTEQLKNKEMKKSYLCVVSGTPKNLKDTLKAYLIKDEKNNVVRLGTQGEKDAKLAVLDYEVVATKYNFSLVKVNLLTGRSHQIRVQMSKQLSTPIFADFKYGDKEHKGNLALWAYQLSFVHPTNKSQMKFVVLPDIENAPWNIFDKEISQLK